MLIVKGLIKVEQVVGNPHQILAAIISVTVRVVGLPPIVIDWREKAVLVKAHVNTPIEAELSQSVNVNSTNRLSKSL